MDDCLSSDVVPYKIGRWGHMAVRALVDGYLFATHEPEAPGPDWPPQIDEPQPPMPATPGEPVLTVADPHADPGEPWTPRPPAFPANVLRPVRRYVIGAVVYPRISVSPDGKGIAIAPSAPDQVIVLDDLDDPGSERVVHLGKPENIASRWRGVWIGGLSARPTARYTTAP